MYCFISMQRTIEETVAKYTQLDCLVNNAAWRKYGVLRNAAINTWNWVKGAVPRQAIYKQLIIPFHVISFSQPKFHIARLCVMKAICWWFI